MAFPRFHPAPAPIPLSSRARAYFKRHSLDEAIAVALEQSSEWWEHSYAPVATPFRVTDLLSQPFSPAQADLLVSTSITKHRCVWPFAELLASRVDASIPCYPGLSASTLSVLSLDRAASSSLDIHVPVYTELLSTIGTYLIAALTPTSTWDDAILDLLYDIIFTYNLTDAVDRAVRPINYFAADPRPVLPPLPLSSRVIDHLLANLDVTPPAGEAITHDEWVSVLGVSALNDEQFTAVVPLLPTKLSSDRNVVIATLATSIERLDAIIAVMGSGEYIDDLTLFGARYAHRDGYLERLLPHLTPSAIAHLLTQPLGLTPTTWPSSHLVRRVCPEANEMVTFLVADASLGLMDICAADDLPEVPLWFLARLLLRVPGLAAYLVASSNHPAVLDVITHLAGSDRAAVAALLTNPAVTLADALAVSRTLSAVP